MRENPSPADRPAAAPVIDLVKRLVVGTRLEQPLKQAHYALSRSKNSLYDAQTIAIMRRVLSPDSNAVDIGAFEGGMLRHMLRLAPRGQHVAFEPQPDRFESLRRAFPGGRLYPFAVGETAGEAVFHRVLRAPALSGLRRRVDLPPTEAVEEIRVTVETLDRVIPGDFPIALVKIDVEGGELGVFRGGVRTLRRTRPFVVFECGLGGADSFGARPEEIFETLTEAIGLRISLLGSWLAGGDPLSRSGFVDQFEKRLNYYFLAHP